MKQVIVKAELLINKQIVSTLLLQNLLFNKAPIQVKLRIIRAWNANELLKKI